MRKNNLYPPPQKIHLSMSLGEGLKLGKEIERQNRHFKHSFAANGTFIGLVQRGTTHIQ